MSINNASLFCKFLGGFFLAVALQPVAFSAPQLYETGPAEDASFVRFVTAVQGGVEVSAGRNARLQLSDQNASTTWQAVRARVPLKATLDHSGSKKDVEVTVSPSEFVTLAAIPSAKTGWEIAVGREKPVDFSAHRVSLGILNFDKGCANAQLKLSGKDVVIIDKVPVGEVVRRMINPVALSVDLFCSGKKELEGVDLGSLRAGSRWTVMLVSSNRGRQLMPILDRMP